MDSTTYTALAVAAVVGLKLGVFFLQQGKAAKRAAAGQQKSLYTQVQRGESKPGLPVVLVTVRA